MNNIPLIILIVLCGGVLGWIIYKMFQPVTYIETEFKSDPDDEYVKWLNKTHNVFIEMLLNTLSNAWFISDNDISQASSTQTDIEAALVTFAYYNFLFRFYIDWKKNVLILGFTTNLDSKHKTYRKHFKMKNGGVNYEKLYLYLVKLYKKHFKEPAESEPLKLSQDAIDELIKRVKKGELNGQQLDLDTYWSDWYKEVVDNGASPEEIANFLCFTAALYKEKETQSEVIEK